MDGKPRPRKPYAMAIRAKMAEQVTGKPASELNAYEMDRAVQSYRKIYDARIREMEAAHQRGIPQAEFRAFRQRALADLIRLSAVCANRGCNRANRCCGEGAPCLKANRALVEQRLAIALGYQALDPHCVKDADLTW